MANDYGYGAAAPPTGINFAQYDDSTESIVDPMIIDRSRSGAVKARILQSSTKRSFRVSHRMLTSTQKAQLIAFLYSAKRGTSFKFGWNHEATPDQYTVLLNAPDGLEWKSSGVYWDVMVPLVEV